MSYIGVEPKSGFIKADQEKITGQTTNYVNLSNAISSLDDVQVHVNYVIQDPSTLTLNSTTQIGLGDTLVSSDVVLVTYLGKAVATQSPPVGGVTNDMLAGNIANSKLATPTTINNNADNRVITGSGTATFTKFKDVPVPVGSALTIPKIVLNTSDKIQAQSSSSSGLLDVSLELLTDIS